MTVASGGTVDVVGDLTVGTVTADGDTSAGDSATMGYTAARGLILTGQGSTNDVTIKNDAGADVITVPTGTQNVTIAGPTTIEATGSQTGLTVEGGTLSLASIQLDGGDNANDNSSIQSKYNIHFKADSGEAIAGRTLNFAVGATQGMSIDSGGDITVSTGNLVIGTSGKGIDFSATADSGGTMTSELLDDYEEGTFTPTLLPSSVSGSITYSHQAGRYIKIGKSVYIQARIITTGIASNSGALSMPGLPFTADAVNSSEVSVGLGSGLAITAGYAVTAHIGNGQDKISLSIWDATTGTTDLQMSEWSSNGDLSVTATYKAA